MPGPSLPPKDTDEPADAGEFGPAVFDEAEFRQTLGDQQLMLTLVELFAEEADLHAEKTRQAFITGDPGELHRATHALKGLLGNYSAPRCYEKARTLDNLVRAAKTSEAQIVFDDLVNELEKLRVALEKFAQSSGH